MEHSLYKRKYLVTLFILTLVAGGGGAFMLYLVFPEYYFSGYPLIPLYFFIFGFVGIYLFEHIQRNTHNKTLMLYAGIRMMKLIISIIVMLICGSVFKAQVKEFLFTFVTFYVIYMIFEVLFFVSFERSLRKSKKENL